MAKAHTKEENLKSRTQKECYSSNIILILNKKKKKLAHQKTTQYGSLIIFSITHENHMIMITTDDIFHETWKLHDIINDYIFPSDLNYTIMITTCDILPLVQKIAQSE